MKLSEMFPSNLLKAQDVTDAGGEMDLKIFSVEMKEFDNDEGGKERKPVLVFANDKRMVLNKTNAGLIAQMFGDDTDKWINQTVVLIVQDVPFGNKTVPAIRVKNLNSKDAIIQAFWAKARELGFERQDGLDHLKSFNNDFKAALESLTNEAAPAGANPFA